MHLNELLFFHMSADLSTFLSKLMSRASHLDVIVMFIYYGANTKSNTRSANCYLLKSFYKSLQIFPCKSTSSFISLWRGCPFNFYYRFFWLSEALCLVGFE